VPWATAEGRRLHGLAMAAAATGTFAEFTAAAFATQKERDWTASIRLSGAERILDGLAKTRDLAPLDALVTAHQSLLDRLANDEQRTVQELGVKGELPQAFLFERATGTRRASYGRDDLAAYRIRKVVLGEG